MKRFQQKLPHPATESTGTPEKGEATMNTEDLPQKVEKFIKLVATLPESGMIEAAKAREVIEAGADALMAATILNGLCRDTILRLCVEKDQLQAENGRLKRLLASGAHSDILANA